MQFHPIRLVKFLFILILLTIFINPIYRLLLRSNIDILPKKEQEQEKGKEKESQSLSISSVDEFKEISYKLDPFLMHLPHFCDNESRNWFLKSSYYTFYSKTCPENLCEKNGFLFNNSKENLDVRLALVKNGLYLHDDCGYNYGDDAIRRRFKSDDEASVIYDKAIIYTVPDGWSFQHFLDGIAPKLTHSKIYLDKYPNAKVIIQHGMRFDQSVKQIWSLLGVNESNRLVHYQSGTKLGARLLINPCRTPGIHPKLWHNARNLYWSIANISRSDRSLIRNKLIYIQRTPTNSKNRGRLILNDQPFTEVLRQYANKSSLEFYGYDHSKEDTTIQKQIQLFYQAKIIIGIHGGAQSNMNFAQPGTTIIEIMPYHPDRTSVPIVCSVSISTTERPCVGYIYYVQSQLLNHSYWMLPTPVNADGNVNVDLNRFNTLLQALS